MLKAVIFDFDGILADAEHIQKEKWEAVLAPYGIRISDEEYGRYYSGKSSSSVIPGLLKERYPQITCSAEEISQAALLELKRLFPLRSIELMPQTLEMLRFAKEKALKTAICSGKTLVETAMKLEKAGLSDWFPLEHRVSQADADFKGKPDPGMYLVALKKLGVAAAEAVVFEDTASGVAAGKAAGIRTVALPSKYSREQDFTPADLVFWGGWPEVLANWPQIEGLCQKGRQG